MVVMGGLCDVAMDYRWVDTTKELLFNLSDNLSQTSIIATIGESASMR